MCELGWAMTHRNAVMSLCSWDISSYSPLLILSHIPIKWFISLTSCTSQLLHSRIWLKHLLGSQAQLLANWWVQQDGGLTHLSGLRLCVSDIFTFGIFSLGHIVSNISPSWLMSLHTGLPWVLRLLCLLLIVITSLSRKLKCYAGKQKRDTLGRWSHQPTSKTSWCKTCIYCRKHKIYKEIVIKLNFGDKHTQCLRL